MFVLWASALHPPLHGPGDWFEQRAGRCDGVRVGRKSLQLTMREVGEVGGEKPIRKVAFGLLSSGEFPLPHFLESRDPRVWSKEPSLGA